MTKLMEELEHVLTTRHLNTAREGDSSSISVERVFPAAWTLDGEWRWAKVWFELKLNARQNV